MNEELEQALSFLRSEEHQDSVLASYIIRPIESGGFVIIGGVGLARFMTEEEIIAEAKIYQIALQRRKENAMSYVHAYQHSLFFDNNPEE